MGIGDYGYSIHDLPAIKSEFCCDWMKDEIDQSCDSHDAGDCPDSLIARNHGDYGIRIHDGGSSVKAIRYCPWCGTKLTTAWHWKEPKIT